MGSSAATLLCLAILAEPSVGHNLHATEERLVPVTEPRTWDHPMEVLGQDFDAGTRYIWVVRGYAYESAQVTLTGDCADLPDVR